jgi:Transport and Golgi organisation 2
MCTVTLLARRQGYALAMNRDEKLNRAAGLPPRRRILRGVAVLAPAEPGGGTWISVNERGVTFALINWYAIGARVDKDPVSRGAVVSAVAASAAAGEASAVMNAFPLHRTNPFRLIGIFPATQEIIEGRWNLNKLVSQKHLWRTRQWASSGFDEPAAQRTRARIFRAAQQQKSAGGLDWLRRLHRSHRPQAGPFSICMHRSDAATVSCAEVMVSPRWVVMSYHPGAPCRKFEGPATRCISRR